MISEAEDDDAEEDAIIADSEASAKDEAENVRDMASCTSPSASGRVGGDPKARLKLSFFVGRAE